MSTPLPVLFLGHGSPMNAIEDNEFRRAWQALGRKLRKPKAILCISAHWETRGVFVTGSERPESIPDFNGFPRALFEVQYRAPGSPELAHRVIERSRRSLMDGRAGALGVVQKVLEQVPAPQ